MNRIGHTQAHTDSSPPPWLPTQKGHVMGLLGARDGLKSTILKPCCINLIVFLLQTHIDGCLITTLALAPNPEGACDGSDLLTSKTSFRPVEVKIQPTQVGLGAINLSLPCGVCMCVCTCHVCVSDCVCGGGVVS